MNHNYLQRQYEYQQFEFDDLILVPTILIVQVFQLPILRHLQRANQSQFYFTKKKLKMLLWLDNRRYITC